MPLCGVKKSKKQKRDPSPPFAPADKVREDAERKVKSLQNQLDDVRAELHDVTASRDRLRKEVTSLRSSTAENKDAVDNKPDTSASEEEVKKKYEVELSEVRLQVDKEKKQRQSVDDAKTRLEDEVKQANKHLETERNQRVKAEEDKNRLKQDKDKIETDLNLTKKELEATKQELLQKSPSREPSAEWKAKILMAETELQTEREQRMERERELSRTASERAQLQSEKESLGKEAGGMKQENESLKKQLDEIKFFKDAKDEQYTELKKNMENMESNYMSELQKLKDSLAEESKAKESALTRLSSVMGNQVLDGNPNLADLSDQNRPSKLGENMCQLYDDSWTDMSEIFEKQGKPEEDIVKTLLNLLIETYKHCKEAADSQLARVEENLFLPPMESESSAQSPTSPNGHDAKSPTSSKAHSVSRIPRYSSSSKSPRPAIGSLGLEKKDNEGNAQPKERKAKRSFTFPRQGKGEKTIDIPVELKKGLKDFRKTVSKQVIPVIQKEVQSKLRAKPEFGDAIVSTCSSYINQCAEQCWLMRIQDPPVVLSWSVPEDGKLDSDVYRAYTKTGPMIDYVVWPVMYLCDGGPILMKGVAQGKQ